MSVARGSVVADRFEVTGDVEAHVTARAWARKGWMRFEEADLWLRGRDLHTGAPVLVELRRGAHIWDQDLAAEAVARRVAALALPGVVPVLHVGGVVVYAEPPPDRPRGDCTTVEAAALAVEACAITAALHAGGVAGLCFDPRNLRVVGEGTDRRIAWLVPGAPDIEWLEMGQRDEAVREARSQMRRLDHVARDVWGLVDFFVTLQPDGAHLPDAIAVLHRAPERCAGLAVAALAASFVPLVPALAVRVAALPRVAAVPPIPLDYDLVIREGEALLAGAGRHERRYYTLHLAAAYHQRVCRAWAAGDRAAALPDAERAVDLDPAWLRYATTRTLALDAAGRRDEARSVIAAALAASPPPLRPVQTMRDLLRQRDSPTAADLARAHATSGMLALRAGDADAAAASLRAALDLDETAAHAHAFGAALYAAGDIASAAIAEARSVELEPENARYRWALVGSLRKLGRDAEARAHAEAAIAAEPDNAVHREQLAALFG
ncbi:MAG: hypothetical protein QM820_06145 [Minicystis sp.]